MKDASIQWPHDSVSHVHNYTYSGGFDRETELVLSNRLLVWLLETFATVERYEGDVTVVLEMGVGKRSGP